jgi:hypothetical protein
MQIALRVLPAALIELPDDHPFHMETIRTS